MKKVLMIAFRFPPRCGSRGVLRTPAFFRHLPDHDRVPVVLTASPRAHDRVDNGQVGQIPERVVVERAFALDAARHLAVRGRYLKWTALPDRWISSWLGAVPADLRLIRKHRPQVIWSTVPIGTAHLIGLTLHCLTGIPWMADCRAPMAQSDFPPDPLARFLRRVAQGTAPLASEEEFARHTSEARTQELACLLDSVPRGGPGL